MNIEIKNPAGLDLNDIKKEVNMTADCIVSKFTYPNGFIMETIQHADNITVMTSSPLIDNGDGTYSIPE